MPWPHGYIIDLDGTVFEWGTTSFISGVPEAIRSIVAAGNDILFITMRGHPHLAGSPRKLPGEEETRAVLDTIGVPYRLVWGLASGRVLIDDANHSVFRHVVKDRGWDHVRGRDVPGEVVAR